MKLNIPKAIKQCRKLINQKGCCYDGDCEHCPGSEKYNNGIVCTKNGWSRNIDDETEDFFDEYNYKNNRLQSATKWLLKYDYQDNIYVEEL